MKTIENKTEAFKMESVRELDFIKSTPFYGSQIAEKFYKLLSDKYNILQVGVCGVIVSIVSYKKDADNMLYVLNNMFPDRRILQKESEYTGFITTYTLPNS